MKILLDMNISPSWIDTLVASGYETIHWSSVGRADALDTEIMSWARNHNFVVFTHDLDFSA
jgi:predicted nuclease of predicted toxin-antitoxin system